MHVLQPMQSANEEEPNNTTLNNFPSQPQHHDDQVQ